MACTIDYIEFVCNVLKPLGDVCYRKMMGDYVIYLDGKCVITACDNTSFIKKLPCVAELMSDAEVGYAYPGAKESYVLDMSHQKEARIVISTLWESLPFPKKRTKGGEK